MSILSKILNPRKVSVDGLILLFTSLSYMSSAGLTMRDGVDIIANTTNKSIPPSSLKLLQQGFGEGLVLSAILKRHEDVFGSGWWRQVEAAERTGKEDECLLRIADQLKNSKGITGKVKGAMAYPSIVVVVALIAAYYLFTNTIPEMGAMMAEFDAELPAITQAMMKICDFLIAYGPYVICATIFTVVISIWTITHPLRFNYHKFITKFFLSSKISINLNYSIIYTLLNDMIENGANLVDAVRIAGSSSQNIFIVKEMMNCASTMEIEGRSLAAALQVCTTMPADDKMMLDVGSRTGRELELLKDLAVRRRVAANESVNQLLELLSPMIMLLVCAIVGVLVVSVYMPMLTMASGIS